MKTQYKNSNKIKDGADRVFGRIKKIPVQSKLFQGFTKDQSASQQTGAQGAGDKS